MCNGSGCDADRVGGEDACCGIFQHHQCQIHGVQKIVIRSAIREWKADERSKCRRRRDKNTKKATKAIEENVFLVEEEKAELCQTTDYHNLRFWTWKKMNFFLTDNEKSKELLAQISNINDKVLNDTSTSTLNRKLNWLFRENAQLRKDSLN